MSEVTPTDVQPKIDPANVRLIGEHKLPRPLTACFWEPQNRFILLGLEDNGIVRFDLESKESVLMVGPHDSWVRAIATSPDGLVTYSGGYDGRLVWWPTETESPEPIRTVDAHQGWIRALAVSPDGSHIATCGNDYLVRLWESESGTLVRSFEGHESHVYNIAFSPSVDRLISCDLKGFVKAWNSGPAKASNADDEKSPETASADVAPAEPAAADQAATASETEQDLTHLEILHKYDDTFRADIGGARCMAFSRDGKSLAIGGITKVTNAFAGVGDAIVALVDAGDGKVVAQYAPKESVRGTAWGIAQHPEGFWVGLTGGGGGGWFYFWRGEETDEFFKFKLKNDGRGMSLSPDARHLAVAHADQHLRVYALFEDPNSETLSEA